jgi:hypothetical protein
MKKNRFNTYLDEDLSKKMTAAMELSDASSESEFIRKRETLNGIIKIEWDKKHKARYRLYINLYLVFVCTYLV